MVRKHVALCCAFVTGAAREDRRTLTYRCPALHCTDPNTELWGGDRLPRLCSAFDAAPQQFFAPQKVYPSELYLRDAASLAPHERSLGLAHAWASASINRAVYRILKYCASDRATHS